MTDPKKDEKFAVLPLRDIVVFPHMIVPLFVGREKSVKALDHVMKGNKKILLVTQKTPSEDIPDSDALYTTGTIGSILQLLKLPDGTVKVLVEGHSRAVVKNFENGDEFMTADVTILEDEKDIDSETDAMARALVSQFEEYVKLNKKIPPEVVVSLSQIEDSSKLADTISSHLTLKIDEKQELLEAPTLAERLERIYSHIEDEIGVLQVEKRIRGRVKRQMEKTQREYYLNEQLKAIQKELGDSTGEDFDEIKELEKRIEETKLSKDAKKKAETELKKLKQMSPMSAEATVVRNYLDWLLGVPWSKRSKVHKDIVKAKEILDTDHYGLEKVKDRILEYLAVQQRMDKVKGPILCLVGPPGVGKTSLGQSIAKATNRKFVRMSLGGVRDESEIRGHRRTYIGAMPGKVIQGMKKAEAINPLFLLDEIDKLGNDWRGDPSSALLEVLDPEQNSTFNDHYMEVDYDLSDVMFICTSNSLNMPRPLLDRMEIIRISGYTEDEKLEIVKRHLLAKQAEAAGLKDGEFSISDNAIRDVIRYYTREAGVRNLEREIANLCRKAIKEILMTKKKKKVSITPNNLKKYAGVRRFRFGAVDEEDRIGVVTGLAYTETGGDLLSIESVIYTGKEGKVSVTGNLKDVMKESITVAEMLIKSRRAEYGIESDFLNDKALHVHVPEGATPKDGPSAGAAMVTSIISSLTAIPVRRDVAMTGEVNLRGHVTAIGGLKEKLLAALRGGIKTVIIPEENKKDLEELPKNVIKGLEIIPVENIQEVLEIALTSMPTPISGDSGKEITNLEPKSTENKAQDVIHH